MKKLLSAILILAMFLCMFSLPCMGIETDFSVNVQVDGDENIITIKGLLPARYTTRWITYFLLYPGKTLDDVPSNSPENPVIAKNGQFRTDISGVFSETFKVSGVEGICNLYIRSADVTKVIEINTETDSKEFLWQMYQLGDTFPERTTTDTKELFFQSRAELPQNGEFEEIPVVEPFPVTGAYYVFVDSENGDDITATGGIDKPFKTCKAALKKFPPESGMVLTLRGGTYPATDAIRLSNISATIDSPFIITNYKDEKVVFSGGTILKGEDFKEITDTDILSRLNPSISKNIRVLDMNAYGITKFGDIQTSYTPALWVEGNEYTIARYPNTGTTGMRECTDPELIDTVGGTAKKSNGVIDCGTVTAAVGSTCGAYRKYSKRATALNEAAGEIVSTDIGVEFMVEDIRPFSWVNTGDIWFYGSVYEEWRKYNFPISEFNPETRSIRTSWGNEWGAKYYPSHNKFYYFNVLEELDMPGEWYLDKKTGMLYVYPTEDLTGKEIIYDATTPSGIESYIIHLENVKNVIVNGITIQNSRGNGIYSTGEDSTHVIVQNCHFNNIRLGALIGTDYSGVINSTFKDLYSRAIQLQAGDSAHVYKLVPSRQFAMNNVIHNTTGIVSSGIGNVVSHNFISTNSGTAIYASGHETIAEYNEIVSGPRVTLDSGAIYSGGNAFKRGVHVRYNYIHDIGHISPRGIYFDDMLSGCYAYGNIVDGHWMQLHGGREDTVYNNIFLNYQNDGKNAIRLDSNYYVSGTKQNVRWKTGNLEYGSMTAPIKPGSLFNQEIFQKRYPILKNWIPMMQERIAEYQITKAPYNSDIYQSDAYPGYTDKAGKKYNLNEYLSASRDNYFGNNVTINANGITAGQDGKTAGYVNTRYENNISFTAAENPFNGENYGDSSAYDKIIAANPDFEVIPFEKMGVTDKTMFIQNEKPEALSPANTTDFAIPFEDVILKWKYVMGGQRYKVELSDKKDFSTVLESTTTVENKYTVTTTLQNDKTYYWRVTSIPDGLCVTGSEKVSDTYMFRTSADPIADFNLVGVTDLTYEETADGISVSAYGFNLTGNSATTDVYAACYDDEGKLLDLAFDDVEVESKEFSEKIQLYLNTSEFDTLKLFVWVENSLHPTTFVRKITK